MIDSIAAFVNVVNGVIVLSDRVIIGASPANTIRQKASAPPKNPIRQTTIANGATIMDMAIVKVVVKISDSKNNNTIAIAPKVIHRKS